MALFQPLIMKDLSSPEHRSLTAHYTGRAYTFLLGKHTILHLQFAQNCRDKSWSTKGAQGVQQICFSSVPPTELTSVGRKENWSCTSPMPFVFHAQRPSLHRGALSATRPKIDPTHQVKTSLGTLCGIGASPSPTQIPNQRLTSFKRKGEGIGAGRKIFESVLPRGGKVRTGNINGIWLSMQQN